MSNSFLEPAQILRQLYDATSRSITTVSTPVNTSYDTTELTYVTSGNGIGEIATVTYKLVGATVSTLTLSYDVNNKLSSVVRS